MALLINSILKKLKLIFTNFPKKKNPVEEGTLPDSFCEDNIEDNPKILQ